MTTMYERCTETVNSGQKCPGQRKFTVMTPYGSMGLCRSHALRYAEWRAQGLPTQRQKWFEIITTCEHGTVKGESSDLTQIQVIMESYLAFDHYYHLELNLCDWRGQRIRLFPF